MNSTQRAKAEANLEQLLAATLVDDEAYSQAFDKMFPAGRTSLVAALDNGETDVVDETPESTTSDAGSMEA